MKNIVTALVLSLAFLSCKTATKDKMSNTTVVNATTVQEIIAGNGDVQILDVRTPKEFQQGHIAGAVNININEGDFDQQILSLDKNKPVIVYCLSGGRSSDAAEKLAAAGFENIYHYKEGMLGWRNSNMPEENSGIVNNETAAGTNMSMADYNHLLEDDKLVMVDFYADWCGPCKAMAPFLDSMAVEHKDKLKLVRIDVDENQQVAQNFGISAIPLLYGYKNKNKVWEQMGFADRRSIEKDLKQYLQ